MEPHHYLGPACVKLSPEQTAEEEEKKKNKNGEGKMKDAKKKEKEKMLVQRTIPRQHDTNSVPANVCPQCIDADRDEST